MEGPVYIWQAIGSEHATPKYFKLQEFEKNKQKRTSSSAFLTLHPLSLLPAPWSSHLNRFWNYHVKGALLCTQERSVLISEDKDTAERNLSEQAFLTSPAGHTHLLHSVFVSFVSRPQKGRGNRFLPYINLTHFLCTDTQCAIIPSYHFLHLPFSWSKIS